MPRSNSANLRWSRRFFFFALSLFVVSWFYPSMQGRRDHATLNDALPSLLRSAQAETPPPATQPAITFNHATSKPALLVGTAERIAASRPAEAAGDDHT